MNPATTLLILESPEQIAEVEALQRLIWPGDDTEIVPAHLLLTAAHNGGLVIGAYTTDCSAAQELGGAAIDAELEAAANPDSVVPPGAVLVGFVFGFVGLYDTPDGPRPKHCSHMLGVHPNCRDHGIGYKLKRAQWQMVRQQGLDRITWTYDPLLSRNAHLNITRLGAVCNTYIREAYGNMRDGLNAGFPSDRFQVDWWVNSPRVNHRLSKRPRRQLDLAHYLGAGTPILHRTQLDADGLPHPEQTAIDQAEVCLGVETPLLLLEIPADYMAVKKANPDLAMEWRCLTRQSFESLFEQGYLVTDFIHLAGTTPRSFYVLSFGEATL